MGQGAWTLRAILLASVATAAVISVTDSASAGGFAIREQSTSSLGAAFAGSAAGYDLSSMYWNPAAAAAKSGPGLHFESHYAVLFPSAEVDVNKVVANPGAIQPFFSPLAGSPDRSGDIAGTALVPATYGSMQLRPDLYLGVGINSPFGLATEPANELYQGSVLGRSTKLFTMNVNPTVAYRVTPGIVVGAGVQAEYAKGKLKFATGIPQSNSTYFEGDDWAFGATAGILVQPSAGTSIGLGWRSQLSHTLEGDFAIPAVARLGRPGLGPVSAEADINLPDIVTFSFRHAVASNMRLLGTVEWSNWSRFEELRLKSPGLPDLVIPAGWSNGWFFSGGFEYDHTPNLTFRIGAAYEISPVDSPEKRIISIPDNDRTWISVGATWQWTPSTAFDVAFSHVFVKDGYFDRHSTTGTELTGTIDAQLNIVAASLKTRW